MGDKVGVHDDTELEGLSRQQRAQIKQQILRQLQTSPEIRAIIQKTPRLLTSDSRINKILKRKLAPTLRRLKRS